MSKPIQVGDFIQISLHGFTPTTYVIRQIDQSGIYISQDSNPNELSLIVSSGQFGQGGWKVHGSDVNYVIQFVANPNIITQLTQSFCTLQVGQPIQEAQLKSIGTIFTGETNVDILILAQLDDAILSSTCQVDKYVASICRNDVLWNRKIVKQFPNAEKFKSKDKKWIEYYKELRDTVNNPNATAKKGYLDVLKWLQQKYIFADEVGANYAAWYGHLDVLKWLAKPPRNIFLTIHHHITVCTVI